MDPLSTFFCDHPDSRIFFDAVFAMIDSISESQLRINKSQISFRRRIIFAIAWMPGQYREGKNAPLVLTISLRHHDPSPRWKEVVEPYPGRFIHHLELFTTDQLNEEVRDWLSEAWHIA